jgi:hypothetical protein
MDHGPAEDAAVGVQDSRGEVFGVGVDGEAEQDELRQGMPIIMPKVSRSRRIWMNSLKTMAPTTGGD